MIPSPLRGRSWERDVGVEAFGSARMTSEGMMDTTMQRSRK